MRILETLLPVFVMIGLGFAARQKQWLSPEHTSGAKTLVFSVLFPVLIFNILFTSQLSASAFSIIAYVTAAFVVCFLIGTLLKKQFGPYGEVVPYMLTTCEGGSVCLPLYLTMVAAQYASNTIMFDMAGTIIAFIAIPILVARKTAEGGSFGEIALRIAKNPFILAVVFGLALNLCGVHAWLARTPFLAVYDSAMNMVTGPIVGVILFAIGYEMVLEGGMLKMLLKLMVLRILLYLCIIAGFFLFFPAMMSQKEFLIAVLLYFMCPTGFALPLQLQPLGLDEKQESFMSSFISLFMIVTLCVYTALVIFF